jgi:ankyrin repeat protein
MTMQVDVANQRTVSWPGILTDQLRVNQEILAETQRRNLTTELRYEDDKHRRCHQAFKTCGYEIFKDFNRPRAKGTCQWVLNHPRYVEWHSSTGDGLLWISADPGCGKSVLAKSLVDRELRGSATHSSCYFFFKDNDEQDHAATALCAILHQLFAQQPGLVRHALAMWEKNGDKMQQEVPELWRTLLAAAMDKDAHDITCILDALDECRPADRQRLIEMLARFHADRRPASSLVKRKRGARLKFLVTSRPYDYIELEFERMLRDLPTIRLRGEEENDQIREEINAVARERVAGLAHELQLKKPVRARLEGKPLGMEHRTYLWLHLALESFSTTLQNSLRPEEEAIEMLPSKVDDAYEKILGRVTKDQREVVRKTLQIVVGSRRALTVPEMAIALGIATKRIATMQSSLDDVRLDSERMKRKLSQWCGLFLFINHDRIYLIHQTAKEFLLSDSRTSEATSGWKHCLDVSKAEEQMARLCVNFLSFEDVRAATRDLSHRVSQHHFLEALAKDDPVQSLVVYATEYWPSHLRAGLFVPDAMMADQLSQFYNTTSRIQPPWFAIYWKATRQYMDKPPKVTALQLAAMLGHEQGLAQFMGHGFQFGVDDRDHDGRTALVWACECGHKKMVQMLLEKGADINANGGRYGYGDALQAASNGGHGSIVQILLEKGADVNAKSGFYGNALQAASGRGHDDIVQTLLEKGADINAEGGEYGNALYAASRGGHGSIVDMLLEKGADMNDKGGFYGNALQAASGRGHDDIVQTLLEKGADVNAQGGEYSNALQVASNKGHRSIMDMLMENGANINAEGGEYSNALQAASNGGHGSIVQMLLEKGADINAEGGEYGNALYAASRGGHGSIVQMLLEKGADINAKGADINAKGGRYGNALQAASDGGHGSIVQMLLEKGADVNAKSGLCGNALYAASDGGHGSIVQMLLEKGADVNAKSGLCGNALYAASDGGHGSIVQMLLKKGADVNAKGGFYGNALQAASNRGHDDIVQTLLEKGAKGN